VDITGALPTVDSVLQLEPEELASYLLEHLASDGNQLHLGNLLNERSTLMKHYNRDERVDEAFREAWAWLEREGLLVPKAYGHFISRRGKRIRGRQDFEAFRRSSVLPRASLHPLIAERVMSSFVRVNTTPPCSRRSRRLRSQSALPAGLGQPTLALS